MLAETHTTTASEFSTTAQDTHPSKAGENASTASALLRSGARDASDNVLNDSQYSRTRSMDSESTIVDSICCSESSEVEGGEKSESDTKSKRVLLHFRSFNSRNRSSREIADDVLDSAEFQTNLNHGIRRFNLNPKKGLKFMQERGIIKRHPNDPVASAAEVAKFLHNTRGLNKEQIGHVLGESDKEYVCLLEEYIKLFSFESLGPTIEGLEVGLRTILAHFKPPGESQKIDRILDTFCKKFVADIKDKFERPDPEHPVEFHPDTTIVIAYLIIMLNVDLHNPNNTRRMSKKQFLERCKGLDQGKDLSVQPVSTLYDRVLQNEIRHTADRDDLSGNLYTNPDKCGFLWKKGSSRIARWRKRWFLLSENTLYYFKHSEDVEPLGWIPLENVQIVSEFGKDGLPHSCSADPPKVNGTSCASAPHARRLSKEGRPARSHYPLGKQRRSFRFTPSLSWSRSSKELFRSNSEKNHLQGLNQRKTFSFDICTIDPTRKGVKSVKMSKKKSIVLGNHEYIRLRAQSRQEAESWIRVLNQKNILTSRVESLKRQSEEQRVNDCKHASTLT